MYPPKPEPQARARRKTKQIRYGAGYWKKLELFTNKIRTLKLDLICLRSARASVSATLTRSKTEKFSKHLFNSPLAKIFSIKKKKNFLFWYSANRRIAETLPQTLPAFGGQGRRAKIPGGDDTQTPFLFARLLGLRPEKFGERRQDILKEKRSRPCPSPPVRVRQKGTPWNFK